MVKKTVSKRKVMNKSKQPDIIRATVWMTGNRDKVHGKTCPEISEVLEKELGVKFSDSTVAVLANSLGIPTFRKLSQGQNGLWARLMALEKFCAEKLGYKVEEGVHG